MIKIADYYSLSSEHPNSAAIRYETGSILFHSFTDEERSELVINFKEDHPEVVLCYVGESEMQTVSISGLGSTQSLRLRSSEDAKTLRSITGSRTVYLDITGLTHSAWAWLIKALLLRPDGHLWVIYSEPNEYRFHDNPVEGQIFDLSEKIDGIGPLPGLASLTRFTTNDFLFMPLLGFEGSRLAYMFENVQPSIDLTFPVIGVPGFHFNYPFHSYFGNRRILEREEIWKNWRYEQANCPASIFVLGENLLDEYKNKALRIAPIGTKPHSLGAVLLKLAFPKRVDIIYDHPIRKTGRTKGISKTLCYWITPFRELIKA